MFILSQYILKNIKICNFTDITSYSIAIGLIIYTSIYLYLLFNNNELLSIFNKFIIYIISIDLLLSSFYYLNSEKQQHLETINSENIKLIDDTDSYHNVNTETNTDIETGMDTDIETEMDTATDINSETENDIDTETEIDIENDIKDDIQDVINIETDNQIKDEKNNIQSEDINIEVYPIQQNESQKIHEISENIDTDTILQKDNSTLDLGNSTLPVKKKRGRKPNILKM